MENKKISLNLWGDVPVFAVTFNNHYQDSAWITTLFYKRQLANKSGIQIELVPINTE